MYVKKLQKRFRASGWGEGGVSLCDLDCDFGLIPGNANPHL